MGSDIRCKDGRGGGGGVVAFYLIFISPPTRFGGYSDQPAWGLSLEKACALNNFNTLRDILIIFGRHVYQVKTVCRVQE